jgi:hypothetical protein
MVQLLLVVAILAIGFDYLILRDIAENPHTDVFTPEVWGLICVLCTPIGGMLYLIYGRSHRTPAR